MRTTNPKGIPAVRGSIVTHVRDCKFTANRVRRIDKYGVNWSISFPTRNGSTARIAGLQTDELVKLYQNLGVIISRISETRNVLEV